METGQTWVCVSLLCTGKAWAYLYLERKEANKRAETKGTEGLDPTLVLRYTVREVGVCYRAKLVVVISLLCGRHGPLPSANLLPR